MTLEEAILHCGEVAGLKCDQCGKEHEQLAKWLQELKERREAEQSLKVRGTIAQDTIGKEG